MKFSLICIASSLVGVIIRALILVLNCFSLIKWCRIGKANAAVLPVPV
tara:strand:+ start:74 stop:217 length:144 start_codon:yes stop_codon:yes gene_type:complete